MFNVSKDYEADQGVYQGLFESNKKVRSMDKVLGRTKWVMLGLAKSALASLPHRLLCKSAVSPITLHGDLGRSFLHKVL